MSALEISLLRHPLSVPADDVAELVNRVYREAERGLWQDDIPRTTPAELTDLVAAGEIAAARDAGEIVGVVRVQRLRDGVGEFAMLACDPAYRGKGVGSALVAFAEEHSARNGCHTMQLELLTPTGWTHPGKEFLRTWYSRIGYTPVRVAAFSDDYPELAPHIATPCEYTIYHKKLLD
ncbi:GNAT family N-acetyltransferase [Nonomuraea typhae]|uniref:GNAT family N-acetyltransferase n=1 Tax=Nonomuraea typhae TaxID=2603600 RepID=UPI0012F99482|nr:GNAT family N-acetyltransferase [Nonomuraea typhae]